MDVSDLEVGIFETTAEHKGHQIAFAFRADVTGRTMLTLKAVRERLDLEPMWAELNRLITHWDLTKDGRPLPIANESWQALPGELAGDFITAILNAVADPNKRRPLRDSWSPMAASEPIASPSITPSSATTNGQGHPSGLSLVSATTHSSGPVGAVGYGA